MNVAELHRRPPAPTLIAIVLLVVAPARVAVFTVLAALHLDWVALILGAGLVLWSLVIVGLWRGGRGAYAVGIVVACLSILSALSTAADLFLPENRDSAGSLQPADGVLPLVQLVMAIAVLLLLLASPRSRRFFARP